MAHIMRDEGLTAGQTDAVSEEFMVNLWTVMADHACSGRKSGTDR